MDAETLVKNDEVISDQVLQYSGGFVSKYDTISEKEDDGLFRVKIKATVERQQVLAKLKDAKVTITAIEGKDLAAEVMTKQEARKNATALLAKACEDLPKCLVAEIVGKPRYEESSASMVVEINVRADMEKYHTVLKRMTPVLSKISLAKSSALVAGEPDRSSASPFWPLTMAVNPRQEAQMHGPKHSAGDQTWAAWVISPVDHQFTLSRCNLYVLDVDPAASLQPLAGEFSVHAEFLAKDGNAVSEDEFPLFDPRDRNRTPMLIGRTTFSIRDNAGREMGKFANRDQSREVLNLVIAPLSMRLNWAADAFPLQRYSTMMTFRRKVKLTLDELGRIKDVRCTVELKTNTVTPKSQPTRSPRSGGRGGQNPSPP